MKKITIFILLLLALTPITIKAAIANSEGFANVKVYVFYQDNCQKCNQEKKWLDEYAKENNQIRVEYLTIKENKELLQKIKTTLKLKKDITPLTTIGSNTFTSFNNTTKEKIKDAIKSYQGKTYCDLVLKLKYDEDLKNCLQENKDIYQDNSPIFLLLVLFCKSNFKMQYFIISGRS